MARDTSIEAYKHIMSTGVLSKRQEQVYDTAYHQGPIGATAVWEEIKKIHPNVKLNSVSPRFAELTREGVLKEVGEYKCPYTKKTVICYDVTSKILLKKSAQVSPTKAQQLRDYLDDLDGTSGDKKISVRRVTKRIRKAMVGIGF